MITSPDLNGYGRLFGGRLMEWIDTVAGIVARRHSGCKVTTAMVDTLCFRAPAYPNDTVVPVSYTHLDVYKRQELLILGTPSAPTLWILCPCWWLFLWRS